VSDPANSPFGLLGLPPRFDLDEAELHRRFIQASAAAHPDRFTDPLDQADAAERAAAINDAYRTLKDPESRANALLALLGGAASGDDKSLPPDLLMEMMEVRERMEDAIASADEKAMRELIQWAHEQRSEHLQRVGELLKRAQETPAGAAREAALKNVRLELNALRYFQRMIEQSPEE
jgi:molecular chaperone HscB